MSHDQISLLLKINGTTHDNKSKYQQGLMFMAHEQNGETALWIAEYKPRVQASPWGPRSTLNAGARTESSDGLTLLPLTGSRFLSCFNQLLLMENLLLLVRGGTSCYAAEAAQCFISFLWTEVRFLQSRFFVVLFCRRVTPEDWGAPFVCAILCPRFGDLIKLCRLEERVVGERCDQGPPELQRSCWWFQKVNHHCCVSPNFKDWRL